MDVIVPVTSKTILILLGVLGVSVACRGNELPTSFTTRDSLGIRVVESSHPAWVTGQEWSVSPEPSLSMGAREGDEALQFFGITGVWGFKDGRIGVLNGGSNTIRIFDEEGHLESEFGGSGDGPGEFRSLGSAHLLPGDTILVWDGRRPGFSLFTDSGEFIRTQTVTRPGTEQLTGIEPLPDGRLLLKTYASPLTNDPNRGVGVHRDSAPLILVDRLGTVLDTVGFFPSRELAITRVAGTTGMGFVPFGKESWVEVRGNFILVGTAESMEYSIFDFEGRLASIIRAPDEDLTVTPEDRDWIAEKFSARVTTPQEQEMLAVVMEAMPFPDTKAAYGGFMVDEGGNVWLRTGRHLLLDSPSRDWTIFSPEGALLGSIQLPEGFEVYEIGADYVLGVWKDEMDVEYVRRYRLEK